MEKKDKFRIFNIFSYFNVIQIDTKVILIYGNKGIFNFKKN